MMIAENLDDELRTYKLMNEGVTGQYHALRAPNHAFEPDEVAEVLDVSHIQYYNPESNFIAKDNTAYFGSIKAPHITCGCNNAFYGDVKAKSVLSTGNLTIYGLQSEQDQFVDAARNLTGGNLVSGKDQTIGESAETIELTGPVEAKSEQHIGRVNPNLRVVNLQGEFRAGQYQTIAQDTDADVTVKGHYEAGLSQLIDGKNLSAEGTFHASGQFIGGENTTNLKGYCRSTAEQYIGRSSEESVNLRGKFEGGRQHIACNADYTSINCTGEFTSYGTQNIATEAQDAEVRLDGDFKASGTQRIADIAKSVELDGWYEGDHQSIAERAAGAKVRMRGWYDSNLTQVIASQAENADLNLHGTFTAGKNQKIGPDDLCVTCERSITGDYHAEGEQHIPRRATEEKA